MIRLLHGKITNKLISTNCRLCSTIKEKKSFNYDALEEVLEENNALKPTHTKSVFAEHDVRNLRYLSYVKTINPEFAVDEIAKATIKKVDSNKVWCDGGDAHLGHPKVYINLDRPGPHVCGYCGVRFEKSNSPSHN